MIYNCNEYRIGYAFKLVYFCMIFQSIMLFLYFKCFEYIFNYHISNMYLLLGIGIFSIITSIIVFCTNLKLSVDVDLDNRKINLPEPCVNGKISFLENLLYFFLGLFMVWIPLSIKKRTSINLEEVENVYVDTKNLSSGKGKNRKNYTQYNVYIVGTFGSAQIQFESRAKRDEFRNAVRQGIDYCKNPNNRKT
ncbi:hypothetical protein O6B96_03400 [Campylobacter ureolyticus]|uniref:hypothetical protein n=1 Tax=Campylobacter ureolyticus TaxID=827 RepID=UPI0022B47004|nr:hypothetical protein [Campylobacter ureolyticus]MCZ6150103.1 hypothetical protein [Campylobacter ureolyticus]